MKYYLSMVNGVPVATESPYGQDVIAWIEIYEEELCSHPMDELKDLLVSIIAAERCGWREK